LRRLSAWCAPPAAALAGAALLAACLPATGAADTAPGLRARAEQLQDGQAALQRTEHGALLALYAAESALTRARAEQEGLEARSRALALEEASLRSRTAAVRRSLIASQERVARTLRELYVHGEADPLAAVLGAMSLDEALTAIESLERAAEQNERLAAEARDRGLALRNLSHELRVRRASLDEARAATAAAAARLQRATSDRSATLTAIRRRNARAAARIDSLLAQARSAEQASRELAEQARIVAETEAETETAPPAQAPAAKEADGLPASSGSRTLVVDAVAYHLPGRTASGLPVGVGVVAVDPNVIPLGTRMFIPGYGPGIAADVGSAVKGNIIDLWMPSTAAALRWGRRTVTITIYG
jgi:3D (Asp-Asp-Asp) domain-containing protein